MTPPTTKVKQSPPPLVAFEMVKAGNIGEDLLVTRAPRCVDMPRASGVGPKPANQDSLSRLFSFLFFLESQRVPGLGQNTWRIVLTKK